jgi:hypothetical protein
MGLLNNIKDRFKNAEFSVAPNKKLFLKISKKLLVYHLSSIKGT